MEKLNLAIIGQGRSGRDIHGAFLRSPKNEYFTVKYVVEADEGRRLRAEQEYPGCRGLADYRELFSLGDVDLVVNATYSDLHYPITMDLLAHGLSVLCEKPFCRTRAEADEMIALAKERGVMLAVFQQTFLAPFFIKAYKLIKSGKLGRITQIDIRYNGFSRRWDWQTLQRRTAGGIYNTGPHPIGMALGFLDFDPETKLVYSRLDTTELTSGDGDDYAKLLLTAPGKPLIDVEIHSNDPYTKHNLKIMGTKGCFLSNAASHWEMKYLEDGENPERPAIDVFLADEAGNPAYCREDLIVHDEEGGYDGSAFNVGTASFYRNLYGVLRGTEELIITPEMARDVIGVAEDAYIATPLPKKF